MNTNIEKRDKESAVSQSIAIDNEVSLSS